MITSRDIKALAYCMSRAEEWRGYHIDDPSDKGYAFIAMFDAEMKRARKALAQLRKEAKAVK